MAPRDELLAQLDDVDACPRCGGVHVREADELACQDTAAFAPPPPRPVAIAATPLARRCAALCEGGFFTDIDDDGDRTPRRVTYACRVCGGTGLAPASTEQTA